MYARCLVIIIDYHKTINLYFMIQILTTMMNELVYVCVACICMSVHVNKFDVNVL